MKYTGLSFLTVTLLLIIIASPGNCQVYVEPHGLAVAAEQDDTISVELFIVNESDEDIEFDISFKAPPDGEERGGPRRDDLGDVLDFFDYPETGWCGMAWNDGEIMLADWNVPRIYLWDVEEEDFVDDADFAVNYNCWSLAFDGETYWVTSDNPHMIRRIERDGNVLQTIDLDWIPTGIAWDGEFLWLSEWDSDDIIHWFRTNGEEIGVFDISDVEDNVNLTLTWVLEHDDPLWAITENGIIHHLTIDFEEETIEVLESELLNNSEFTFYGLTHDTENLWFSTYIDSDVGWGFGIVDDGIEEVRWLSVDVESGVIGAQDEEVILLTFQPIDLEAGVYEKRMLIKLGEAGEERDFEASVIEMSAVMSLESPALRLYGTISDASTEDAISYAAVKMDRYLIDRLSGAVGEYSFADLPVGDYEIAVSADGYLPFSEAIVIEEDVGDYELNVQLYHGELILDADSFSVEMSPDSVVTEAITGRNEGNGLLTFKIEVDVPSEFESFENRATHQVSDTLRDPRITGVVFVDGNYYVTGSNADDPAQVYVLNREGGLERSFDQIGDDDRGTSDLAWDGELLWGPYEEDIYAFNTNGEAQDTIISRVGFIRGITWDPDRGAFWICGTTTDISLVDYDGEIDDEAELDRYGFRMSSLSYWQHDPDGYNLYICHADGDLQVIHKMNTTTNDTMFVFAWDDENGDLSGSFITSDYDLHNWTFIALADDAADDRIEVWQLSPRMEWLSIDPAMGSIETEEEVDFALEISSVGIYTDALFEGNIDFYHDGFGGEASIPVSMSVIYIPPNDPPSAFDLLMPLDEDTLNSFVMEEMTFSWQESVDPDEDDEVVYSLWLQSDGDSLELFSADTVITLNLEELADSFGLSLDVSIPVFWWVTAFSGEDTIECNERFSLLLEPNLLKGWKSDVPIEFGIHTVNPNPFNSSAVITYGLVKQGWISIELFDISGRKVKTIELGVQPTGVYSTILSATDLPSGIFIIRLQTPNQVSVQKVMLIR